MRRFLLIANSSLLVAASVAFVTLATTAHAQTITTFDPANSTSTVPQAINIFGQVTGYYTDGTGGHGFVRQRNGQITKFDITQGNPGGPVFAQDINPSGQIVGYFFSEITTRGFLRQPDGSIIILSAPTFSVLPRQHQTLPLQRRQSRHPGKTAFWIICCRLQSMLSVKSPDHTVTADV